MEIIYIRTLRGPNYWSDYRKKLIHMRLDLGIAKDTPANEIPGFPERLEKIMPSLISRRCREQKEGRLNGTFLKNENNCVTVVLKS